jgi:hypothetical protein
MSKQSLNRVWDRRMFAGGVLVATLAVSMGSAALAKKKEKAPLPEVVVKAQSVAVLILPGTREPIRLETGQRNRTWRKRL